MDTRTSPGSRAKSQPTSPVVRMGRGRGPGDSVRVLIIPGLHDSNDAHWQTWLQSQYVDAVRVRQADWTEPDLDAWSRQIDDTLLQHRPDTRWVAVAHSFGSLALAHHLAMQRATPSSDLGDAGGVGLRHGGIAAALMVAPADPLKFQLEARLPRHTLGVPLTVIGSENDPWMPLARAREWAHLWGAGFRNLGQVGHINTESGFGPWPLARQKVDHMIRQVVRHQPCLCKMADSSL